MPLHKKIKLGVLVSGRGSNLQSIIEACEQNTIDAKVAVVVSNNAKAHALERAKKHHIPALVVSAPNFETKILKIFKKHQVELVCLAGFMKILSKRFIKGYPYRIINIHPSLLPSFPGLDAQGQALRAGVKKTGATVHFVEEGCDTGPIILQREVPVYEDDTQETLSARILEEEHKIYPQAIGLIATEGLKIDDGRVCLVGPKRGKNL